MVVVVVIAVGGLVWFTSGVDGDGSGSGGETTINKIDNWQKQDTCLGSCNSSGRTSMRYLH